MAEAFPSASSSVPVVEAAATRLIKAESFKQMGNELYRNKDYKKAVGKYHRALLQVKDIDRKGGSQMLQGIMGMMGGDSGDVPKGERVLPEGLAAKVAELEMSCYNNLAACLLHDPNPNYERIVKYCDSVLEHDRQNSKALYRRGVALYHRRDYSQAKESLNQALKLSDKDPDILRYLRLCDQAVLKHQRDEKQMFQGVFRKMAEEDADG